MNKVGILLPHQLFKNHAILDDCDFIYLVEEHLFFRQYKFHKQKLAFHRASMKAVSRYLSDAGRKVVYISSKEKRSDIRLLIADLVIKHPGLKLHIIDPTDEWLTKRINKTAHVHSIALKRYENPSFLNTTSELAHFFKEEKQKFFQTTFYKQQRKARNILLDGEDKPLGGKWTYDSENRKRFPKSALPPAIQYPGPSQDWEEAASYIEANFPDNPGEIPASPLYPVDHETSEAWFRQFLEFRFHQFGDYEDAIVANSSILHHSVITPMMNTGLLEPEAVLQQSLDFALEFSVPINSIEGFVRQIIGWREFMRGMYECKGNQSRTMNFWRFDRKIPDSFYTGTTGIPPIDLTIQKVLKTGYCHHIERLMVLGNFMLLCEFDPDEVYRWFMELFIDAYDWVMVPNVYGMSQFADGGLFATKPYISGSNYLKKMSDYPKGPWQQIWDGLFWRFMHVHRNFFRQNPRTSMLLNTYDRMSDLKRQTHLNHAQSFLEDLDNIGPDQNTSD